MIESTGLETALWECVPVAKVRCVTTERSGISLAKEFPRTSEIPSVKRMKLELNSGMGEIKY